MNTPLFTAYFWSVFEQTVGIFSEWIAAPCFQPRQKEHRLRVGPFSSVVLLVIMETSLGQGYVGELIRTPARFAKCIQDCFYSKLSTQVKNNELNLKQAMSIMENHNIFLHLLNGCCHIVEIFYYALLCTTSIVCFCLLVAIWLVSFCFAGKVKSLLNNCRKTVVLTGNHLVLNDMQ